MDLIVYCIISGLSLFKLCKESTFINTITNLCFKLKLLKCLHRLTTVDENTIKAVDVNIKQCCKIHTFVKAGDLIKVIGYKTFRASMLIRYTINVEEQAKDYIETY